MFGPAPFMSVKKPTFYNMLRRATFAQNEILCALDVAAIESYDGTGQTWTDLSGNSNSFFRGATSGSETSDPTFAGVAGARTASEKWAFDGGDYFTETAAHTFMEPFHKDNAVGAILGVVTLPAVGSETLIPLFGNEAVGNTGTVFFARLFSGSLIQLQLLIRNGLNLPLTQTSSSFTYAPGSPFFYGVSLDESVGAGGGEFFIDSQSEAFDSTYTSPSSGDSTAAYKLFRVLSIGIIPNNCEGYVWGALNVRPTSTQRTNLRNQLRSRYTTLP